MTLLADIESFFGIVVFLIALMGWVVNLVSQTQQQNKRPGQRRGNQPANRPANPNRSSVQNEIDQFLSQSRRSGGRVAKQPQTEEVEVISPPSARRPPPPRRRRRTREEVWQEQTGQKQSPAPQQPQKQSPKRQSLSERRREKKRNEPKKVSAPISSIAEHVEKDLPHTINESVETHLQSFTAGSPSSIGQLGISSTTASRKSTANHVGTLLRSKSGIRNAILLNEILSPPKALKKPRG